MDASTLEIGEGADDFLRENSDTEVWPIARPARFDRDDHNWSGNQTLMKVPKNRARTYKLIL